MSYNWSSTDVVGQVYEDKKKGFVLCGEHTGDNYYKYIPLKITLTMKKFEVIPLLDKTFHAYGGGSHKVAWEPTNRQFHLLMAGETIKGSKICLK